MGNEFCDRHVLAAAVRSRAEAIVTYNLRHFPLSALKPYSLTAVGPSAFLKNLLELDRNAVQTVLQDQAMAISQPMEYLLERLRVNVPGFVDALLRVR